MLRGGKTASSGNTEGCTQRCSRGCERLFQIWKPDEAKENPKLQEVWDEITDGSNLIFLQMEKNVRMMKRLKMHGNGSFWMGNQRRRAFVW